MLNRMTAAVPRDDRGDTLIEVTIALSILAFVLLTCTAVVSVAFRTGQAARERTVVAEAAQEQMEALRSFRDNAADWATFQADIDPVATGFHMELQTVGATTGWVPTAAPTPALDASDLVASGMSVSNWVPTATMMITSTSPVGDRGCGYDFTLSYSFQPLGGGNTATNEIKTRLTNLHYSPPLGGPACP